MLDIPPGPELLKELLRREISVDFRPSGGLRVSPHFYKTVEEIGCAGSREALRPDRGYAG